MNSKINNKHMSLLELFVDTANTIKYCFNIGDTIKPVDFATIIKNENPAGINYNVTKLVDKSISYFRNNDLEGITNIGNYAFYDCKNLALTSLPEGITSIGQFAFRGCKNLALTSLPEGITSIGHSAFYGCTNLSLTSLPESITSIDQTAFSNCTDLKAITFKGTPITIASSAFRYCFYLTTINVPWSEGEVAGAPWGATNATINYNYTGG